MNLIVPSEQTAQPQQQQVQIGLNFLPNGVALRIPIGPITIIEQIIPEEMMNQLCQQWKESRRALAQQQALIADVMRTKAR